METVPINETYFLLETSVGLQAEGMQGPGQPVCVGGRGRMPQACLGVRPAAFFSEELKPLLASFSPWGCGLAWVVGFTGPEHAL